jgi:hypothetical protein
MVTWEIESVEAQGNYVILNMKYDDDHVNVLMEYLHHTFSHNYAINNVSEEGKRFDLDKLFGKYSLSQLWEPTFSPEYGNTEIRIQIPYFTMLT